MIGPEDSRLQSVAFPADNVLHAIGLYRAQQAELQIVDDNLAFAFELDDIAHTVMSIEDKRAPPQSLAVDRATNNPR